MKGGVVPGGIWRSAFWATRGHLRHRGGDIHTGLEEDLDDAVAGDGLAFDMLDIADGGGQ